MTTGSATESPGFVLSPMGEAALLVEAVGPLSSDVQGVVWRLAAEAVTWSGVAEVVPGMNNLLLVLDPACDFRSIEEAIARSWSPAGPAATGGRDIEVPVAYGGADGPDLAALAVHAGLSVDEVVRRHSSATYTVFALGSHPGFGYLAGLDASIAMPRRPVPRTRVEAGSVVVGGAQAGVIAATSPSGWHVVGRTGLRFFDPTTEPPALLAPGDRVRFVRRGTTL